MKWETGGDKQLMSKNTALLILDKLITCYVDSHEAEEDRSILDNIDDFEKFVEDAIKIICN